MDAKHWKLGIIGWPLGYSLSPLMQMAALEAAGLKGEYREIPVEPEELERWLETEAPKLDGFNVTMPHKEAIYRWLASSPERGRVPGVLEKQVEAVNTVVVHKGQLIGHNTDGEGFLDALVLPPRALVLKDWHVLLLGAGGSARAIAASLAFRGRIGRLTVWNRHSERARRLAYKIQGMRGWNVKCQVEVLEDLGRAPLSEVDMLVNATPAGMEGELPLPVDIHKLRREAWVYDIVYSPLRTPLLRAAEQHGNPTIGGFEMLVGQGGRAFHLWTRSSILVREEMLKALKSLQFQATGGAGGEASAAAPAGRRPRTDGGESPSATGPVAG